MTLVDPMGKLIVEVRTDATVAAITTRIRGGAPWPEQKNAAGVVTMTADSLGPGHYQAFVVVTRLGRSRLPRCPIQAVRFVAKCYGVTDQAAETLAGAVSDAVHAKGHRTNAAGVAIFGSFDDGGEGAVADPDTAQPHADIFIEVGASTELLPPP